MEELNTALARLIEQATTGIDASVGFLQEQLPDVVVQLLMWHGVKSGIWFGIGGISIVLGLFLMPRMRNARKGYKKSFEDGDEWACYNGCRSVTSIEHDFAVFMTYVWPLASVVIGFIVLASNLTWLQIWIAPKVWLLEYAANLVK
jgi:hypothetical protein